MMNTKYELYPLTGIVMLALQVFVLNLSYASDSQAMKDFFESCPEAKLSIMADETDNQVNKAIHLIGAGRDIDSSLTILENASRLGKDKATYTLGWLYMGGLTDRLDKEKAYQYLTKTKGERERSAQILIAVLYAEGTSTIRKNRNLATDMFKQLHGEILQRWELFKNQNDTCSVAATMKARKILYEDHVVLKGYADAFGINLE